MPSTLDSCEKYFKTRDIYKIFEIEKTADDKEIKKAYYKLSLKYHPDRVDDAEKEIATEKFKIFSILYQLLTDKNRRGLYDEHGIVDDENTEEKISSWLELWRSIFKPISVEDIDNFKKSYEDSEMERNDIKRSYLQKKGCINYMTEHVLFMTADSEPRIKKIVQEMIDAGEVPEYKQFTNEPKAKTQRRHNKEKKEKLEYEKEMTKRNENGNKNDNNSLEKQIMERQQNRAANANNFFDSLLEKYGGMDDEADDGDVAIDFVLNKKVSKAKARGSKAGSSSNKKNKADSSSSKKNKANNNEKVKERVKSGRVTRSKK